jgi:TRAP-type C4-dicarboxylate transport system permease small subunit
MQNEGIQLFINVCIALICLVILKVGLQMWDRKAKARQTPQNKKASVTKKK